VNASIIVHFVKFVQFVHPVPQAHALSPMTPDPAPMPAPIHLRTVADLLAHHHTLGLYCLRCDRWAEAPLANLAARGLADRPIQQLNFRCVTCGRSAQCQLRPPALSPVRSAGWMEPQARLSSATPRGDCGPDQPPPTATAVLPSRRRRHGRRRGLSWNIIVEQ